MDMFKKGFDRVKQTVEEKIGDAEKTEYDPEVQALISREEDIKLYTEKILSAIEIYLQPDPAVRMLPGLAGNGPNKAETVSAELGHLAAKLAGNSYGAALQAAEQAYLKPDPAVRVRMLPGLAGDGPNKAETVSAELGHLAAKLAGNSYGAALQAAEQAYLKIGNADREFLTEANKVYMVPIKRFLNEEITYVEQEKKTLATRRLDMDSAKGKAARNAANSAAQQDLANAEKAFTDRQDVVRHMIKIKVEPRLPDLHAHLRNLVNAQLQHARGVEKLLDEATKKF